MDQNFPRLLETLAILQRTDRLSTPEIRDRLAARGHQVTARTVQRDLEQLEQAYPLECDRRARPFAWRWRDNAPRLSLPSMDWPEAVSFQLLSSYLDGVLPGSVRDGIQPYVDEARRKIEQHFDNLPLRQWPRRVRVVPHGQPFVPPKVSRAVHMAVTEAVLLGRQLTIRYRGFDKAEAKDYRVSPLGLVQHGAVFYVPARFDGHDDVRMLTLHRIQRATLLDTASGIESFDLGAWLDGGALGFGGQEQITLELRLYENAGERLAEAPLAADQALTSAGDGIHILRATVLDTVQLRRWLLSLGARVEVIGPGSLRRDIGASLGDAAARYRRVGERTR